MKKKETELKNKKEKNKNVIKLKKMLREKNVMNDLNILKIWILKNNKSY